MSALQKSPAAAWHHQKINCRGEDYRRKGRGETVSKLINFNRPGNQLRRNFRGRQRIRRPERLPERCVSRAPGAQKRQQKPKRRPVDTPKIVRGKKASVNHFCDSPRLSGKKTIQVWPASATPGSIQQCNLKCLSIILTAVQGSQTQRPLRNTISVSPCPTSPRRPNSIPEQSGNCSDPAFFAQICRCHYWR